MTSKSRERSGGAKKPPQRCPPRVVCSLTRLAFAQARFSEALPDWIGAHVDTLTFLGGVPKALVCDNLKAGVTAASRYEPGINRTCRARIADTPSERRRVC